VIPVVEYDPAWPARAPGRGRRGAGGVPGVAVRPAVLPGHGAAVRALAAGQPAL